MAYPNATVIKSPGKVSQSGSKSLKMDPNPKSLILFLLLLLLLILTSTTANTESPSTYIVHVSSSHSPALYSTLLSSFPNHLRHPSTRILYSYKYASTGFSAILTPSQASHLLSLPSILAVHPDQPRYPHTTHTPSFLHLSNSSALSPLSASASDIVIALLDTGIYPSRPSFDDSLLPPLDNPKWRGSCAPSFPCNKKIIGAKFFARGYEAAMGHPIDESKEFKSPLDSEGHGTHTASTAGGSTVVDAGFFSYAKGTARGMATNARIAAYKICWANGCYDSDILAAMDEAIGDGVDVISLSVGANGYPPAFYRDSIAIGAFGAAVKHGVVVSCSAGNSGPGDYTAVNVAPWILTVGASTIDREFPADVLLGDGTVLPGVSLYAGEGLKEEGLFPLVAGKDCGSRYCYTGSLNASIVAGKIVVCDRGGNARVEKGSAVKLAGGVGMIMANTAESGEELLADSHLVPATMVGATVGDKIRTYIATDPAPTANIVFRGTVIGPSPAAPKVASFSSRGPNFRAHEIIKPDVIAPGVNILAAWTGESAPTDLEIDPRRVEFNIISGTSMSCPHVSGLAALLKKAHPDWSPAAIKSALMTTAYNEDNSGETIKDLASGVDSTPFARGSGHVDPNKALDPGLVYDLEMDDYVAFLCSVGYTSQQIAVVARDGVSVNCSQIEKKLVSPGGLNYPSFSVVFNNIDEVVTYKRVVKNVGDGASVYKLNVVSPDGVVVTVNPSELAFSGDHGKSLSYEITFASNTGSGIRNHRFGWISWSDAVHEVRSPIAVAWSAGLSASI